MEPTRPHHLLFVCTANICRSPMAEALARRYADQRGWRVEARSAGVMGLVGKEAAPNAVRVLAELEVDLSTHRSQGLSEELVDWADHILVMELRHQIDLHTRFPESEGKVLMLATFGGMHEVADPIGGWRWRFRRSRDEIRRCVERFMDHLPPRPFPMMQAEAAAAEQERRSGPETEGALSD